MRISKHLTLLFCILYSALCTPVHAQIGMKELGDSLMACTGFSPAWASTVRVRNLRTSGNSVTVKTNATLRDFRWTPQNVAEIKRKVSMWTLGHPDGKITILSNGTDIETLITDCARQTAGKPSGNSPHSDLTDRTIVLYPSHGMFYHREREEWIWQRAGLLILPGICHDRILRDPVLPDL